jgi:hypothetical protein
MHIAWRYVIAVGVVALGLIGFSPTYWFFLVYLVQHPTMRSFAVTLVGTAIGSAALQTAGMHCSKVLSGYEQLGDDRLRHGDFVGVRIGSMTRVVPQELLLDLASARVESSPLWRLEQRAKGNEVYVLIYQSQTVDAPWTPGSAFFASVGHRIAIIRDNPLTTLKPWARFLLLHELAHVSSEGVKLHITRWRFLLTMLHGVMTVLLLRVPLDHPLLVAVLVGAFGWSLLTFCQFERLCESYADATAFRALTLDEKIRVLALMKKEATQASVTFGPKHFHARLWRNRLTSLEAGPRPSVDFPSGGTIFNPSLYPFIIGSLASAILAWSSTDPSRLQWQVYGSWCVLCQLLAVFMHTWAKDMDARVLIEVHKKLVSVIGGSGEGDAPNRAEARGGA